MKLLHSKSTAEPVLAVSACPCANLFGLVTRSTVTVYRSTTLTTVFTLSLLPYTVGKDKQPQQSLRGGAEGTHPLEQAEDYHCCWSPSGRLFTLALPSGMILIFDVEGGNLARVFTPASNAATTRVGGTSASVVGEAPASPASPSSSTSSSAFPATVPWVATSLPSDSPVLAMLWCGIPSLASSLLAVMTNDVQRQCLPVRLGVTAALFDEATQGPAGDGASNSGGVADPLNDSDVDDDGTDGTTATCVSLLLVLGSDGVLRCIVGGLYEMYAVLLTLPPSFLQRGLTWKDVCVQDVQLRLQAVSRSATSRAALVAFGDCLDDPVLPATQQHHRLYLTVRFIAAATTATGAVLSMPSQGLWETCLLDALTSLAVPKSLATCYVREYLRIAHEAYEKAVHGWCAVLRDRVLANLGLPTFAPLLASALMAQLTDPDPIELYKYARQTLMRVALLEDLEAMAKMVRAITYEVTHVCYRCCEAAMAYAMYTSECTAAGDISVVTQIGALRHHYETFLRKAVEQGECARDLAVWVMQQSIHWESGTHFVMGGDYTNTANALVSAGDGAADAAAAAEEDRREARPSSPAGRAGSPSPLPQPAPPQQPVLIDEVPVSATRQPALFRFLLERMPGEATSGDARGSDLHRVTSLYEQLRSDTAGLNVQRENNNDASSWLQCVEAQPPRVTAAATQLLCCVVEDAAESVEGETSTTANSDVDSNSDRDGSASNGEEEGEDGHRTLRRRPAGVQRITSQPAALYALQSLPGSAGVVGPLQLSAAALALHSPGGENEQYGDDDYDEQHGAGADVAASAPCSLLQQSAAEVDVSFLASHLKADITKEGTVAFTSSWYGLLEEDRHVLVCQPTAVLASAAEGGGGAARWAKSSAPFFMAVVQDDGAIFVADAKEEEEESEGEAEDEEGSPDAAVDGAAAAARVALCQVAGMEGIPLRVSMSRSRSFCVVVGITKYVVVSLYDDDY